MYRRASLLNFLALWPDTCRRRAVAEPPQEPHPPDDPYRCTEQGLRWSLVPPRVRGAAVQVRRGGGAGRGQGRHRQQGVVLDHRERDELAGGRPEVRLISRLARLRVS